MSTMKTLIIRPADVSLAPLGAGSSVADARVSVVYDRDVWVDGQPVPRVPLISTSIPTAGLRVPVLASDDPSITEGAGFVIKVVLETAPRIGQHNDTGTRLARTIQVVAADPDEIPLGSKPNLTPVPDPALLMSLEVLLAQAEEIRDGAAGVADAVAADRAAVEAARSTTTDAASRAVAASTQAQMAASQAADQAAARAAAQVGTAVTDGAAAWGISDASGRAIDILMPDGTLADAPMSTIRATGESVAAWGIQGVDGRVIDVVMPDGSLAPTMLSRVIAQTAESLGLARLSPTQATLHIGTSLTAGVNGVPYPTQLQTLTGQVASNQGWAGRNSYVFAAGWGAMPFLSTADLTIPTSGSVAVKLNIEYGGARGATIAGVTGSLARVDALNATFTPSVYPPAPVSVPAGSQVQIVPWADYSDRIFILECSRNDPDTLDPSVTISHIDDLVRVVLRRTMTRKFLVMGEPMGATDSAASKAARQARNAAIKAAFPGNYVAAFEWLLTDACAAYLGVTWTDQDRADISGGVTPTTLRAKDAGGVDPLHPNALGNKAIAYQLMLAMQNRGWIK